MCSYPCKFSALAEQITKMMTVNLQNCKVDQKNPEKLGKNQKRMKFLLPRLASLLYNATQSEEGRDGFPSRSVRQKRRLSA